MAKKLYGNIYNRIGENKMYCDRIEVGTGVTEYQWSDRHPYEVVKVIDQTHIYIRELDHKLKGSAYSNDWELISNPSNPLIELKKHKNIWCQVLTYTKEKWQQEAQQQYEKGKVKSPQIWYDYVSCMANLTEKQRQKIEAGKTVKRLRKFGNISFGVAEYYYDYEF